MAILDNQRHEKFAQCLAQGMSDDAAYQEAGYKPSRFNAHRLSTNEHIRKRAEELKARAAASVSITREWVLEQLVENARLAKEAGDFGPSNRALELVGKEAAGMFVEKTENMTTVYNVSGELPSDEEWAAKHAATSH